MKSSGLFAPLALLGMGLLLLGCGSQRSAGTADESAAVANAVDQMKLADEGKNKELTFKAPHYGMLDLFDSDTGQFVWHGFVNAGDKFDFFPASSRALVNKEPVDLERGTNEQDTYRLYFTPR